MKKIIYNIIKTISTEIVVSQYYENHIKLEYYKKNLYAFRNLS